MPLALGLIIEEVSRHHWGVCLSGRAGVISSVEAGLVLIEIFYNHHHVLLLLFIILHHSSLLYCCCVVVAASLLPNITASLNHILLYI